MGCCRAPSATGILARQVSIDSFALQDAAFSRSARVAPRDLFW